MEKLTIGDPANTFKYCLVLDTKTLYYIESLKSDITKVTAERDELGEQVNQLSSLIYNEALGKLAMNYSVDIEYMAEKAYEITGINAQGEANEKK